MVTDREKVQNYRTETSTSQHTCRHIHVPSLSLASLLTVDGYTPVQSYTLCSATMKCIRKSAVGLLHSYFCWGWLQWSCFSTIPWSFVPTWYHLARWVSLGPSIICLPDARVWDLSPAQKQSRTKCKKPVGVTETMLFVSRVFQSQQVDICHFLTVCNL